MHSVEIELADRKITLETGKVAKQANGTVVVRSGDSVVLVSACTAPDPKPGAAFFPLTVDYREYTYAAGKFPGGFIKREGRPSEKETLTSRLTDRPIRPLFPEGYSNETQVIGLVLSADPERDTDTLNIVGAAAALAISDIPFYAVLGAVRIGSVDGRLIVNPSYEEVRNSKLNIVVAATDAGIVMVEAGAKSASEDGDAGSARIWTRVLPQDHRRNSRAGRQSRQAEKGVRAAAGQPGDARPDHGPGAGRAHRRAQHREIPQAGKPLQSRMS